MRVREVDARGMILVMLGHGRPRMRRGWWARMVRWIREVAQ